MPSKGPFNIWLKNLAPGGNYWGEGNMWGVGTILVEYFTQSCVKTSQFSIASYSWDPVAGLIADHELLIYFLPSAGSSIIATLTKQPLGKGGSTVATSWGVISEVYLDKMQGDVDDARLAANVAYHELMHNKLHSYLSGGGRLTRSPYPRGRRIGGRPSIKFHEAKSTEHKPHGQCAGQEASSIHIGPIAEESVSLSVRPERY